MKRFIVTVLVNNPVCVDYLVEAENKEDAIENYGGFPVINEEPYFDNEDNGEIIGVKELNDE